MKKHLLLIGVGILSGSAYTYAETLSPEDALSRAIHYEQDRAMGVIVSPTLAYTSTSSVNGAPGAYVFNNAGGRGYVVVSADDVATPLLGYSDFGKFDPANIAPSLRYWLEFYADQIASATKQEVLDKVMAPENFTPISPMTKTKWDQDSPYNDLCPTQNGKKCVTGCVATAMAQTMKYYNYPAKGIGSNSYSCSGQQLSVNFDQTEYDWDNMLDNYFTGEYTDQQAQAVATLMYSCGVSVNMSYSPSESGASSYDAFAAMVNNFGYDKSMRMARREYFSDQQWQQMAYEQLQQYGPFLYGGAGSDGGHEFVCDGYSSDGYFHFNWGWSGMSNGYFLLSALDPMSQGIGGNTSGFNYQQDILINLHPDSHGNYYEQLYGEEPFSISNKIVKLGERISASIGISNYSLKAVTPTLGIAITSKSGDVIYELGYVGSSTLQPAADQPLSASLTPVIPTTLSDGDYTLEPAYLDSYGTWHKLPVIQTVTSLYKMKVRHNKVTFSQDEVTAPKITSYTLETDVYIQTKFMARFHIRNNDDQQYFGPVYAILVSNGSLADMCGPVMIDLGPSQEEDIDFMGMFSHSNPGTYTFCFGAQNPDNEEELVVISSGTTINLTNADTQAPTISNVSISGDNSAVDASNIQITFTASQEEGIYYQSLHAAFFTPMGRSSVSELTSEELFLKTGDSENVTISGNISADLQGGQTYMVAIFGEINGQMQQLSDGVSFTVAQPSGINNILIDSQDILSSVYYTLDGIMVQGTPTQPGHYIRVDSLSNGAHVSSHRLIK